MATNMKVLDTGVYDAILGDVWLKSHSPMTCNWDTRTIKFHDLGTLVKIQGVLPAAVSVSELSAEQLVKWEKGNELWDYAIVEHMTPTSEPVIPPSIEQLLLQYQDVINDPKTLPASRIHDHTVPLIPGSTPVNSRPYKYSPHHKDEIEAQVKQLMEAGLITHSNSPFASPVLLVQKKDGS